jgi:predicted ArsR family transcriptional regulator
MGGTTASIARLIRDGNMTIADCARRLGVTKEQLGARLRLMEQQGYLARATPQKGETCTCSGCCAACSCCNVKNTGAVPVVYTLTRKGGRLV